METKALIKGLKRAKRAIKGRATSGRFYNDWYLLRAKDGYLFIYGTDSRMLSREQIADPEYCDDFDTLLSIQDADKLIKDGLTKHGENVVVTADKLQFDDGLVIKLNPNDVKNFPINIESVIPQRYAASYEFEMNVKDLKDQLKRLKPYTTYVQVGHPTSDLDEIEKRSSALTKDPTHLCKLIVSKDGVVTISSYYAHEPAEEIAKATNLNPVSNDLRVVVNRTYLEKALMDLPARLSVMVRVQSALRPVVLESDDHEHLYVACPVRTF